MVVKMLGHRMHAVVDDVADIDLVNWEVGTEVYVINTTSKYCIGTGGSLIGISLPRSFTAITLTLNNASQLSATRDAFVSYPVDISVTSALIAGQSGTAVLEYADNSGMSTNVMTVCQSTTSTGGVLSLTNIGTANLCGIIPAGKYHRVRTVNNTGTPTFTSRAGQQILL